jgi:hypothetical protein
MTEDPHPEEEQTVAEMRSRFDPEQVPPGWAVEPIRWGGRDLEIGYDPRRHTVMRVHPADPAQHVAVAERLTATGCWARIAVDRDGAELWLGDRSALAHALVDQLRQTGAVQPAVSIT